MMWPLSFRVLVLLVALCLLAHANTEIRHFKPGRMPKADKDAETALLTRAEKDAIVSTLVSGHLTPLTGPYETIGFERLAYQQSTIWTNKERWYSLNDLAYESSYELRVSYAATTPSDFELALFTFEEVLAHYGKPPGKLIRNAVAANGAAGHKSSQDTLTTMYAMVTASYAGVSAVPGLENQQVPYMLTLEKHVLGLPVQALWLILVLVVVISAAIFIVSPRVLSAIDGIVAEEKLELQKSI